MKSKKLKKLSALVLAGAVTGTMAALMPSSVLAAVDISNDFESNVEGWTGRGGVEVIEVSDEASHGGSSAMCVSGREKSWNGPQFRLDEICEPGVEYTINAWAKSEWYSTLNLSMEYTDTEGERHYSNLKSAQGDQWTEFSDVKVSFTEDMTNVYIYFECSDATCKLYVDDFSIKDAPIIPIEEDIPSLKDVYKNYFKIGTAVMASNLSSPSFMNLVEKHFNESMTFGNELKPDSVLDQKATLAYMEANDGDDTNPQVTLSAARSLLNYCRDNNIPVRGHTLVWHSQTPDWFFKEGFSNDGDWVSKEKMIQRMENYIKNVMETLEKEYPDLDIYAWDVVNEAWLEDGKPRTAGSNNVTNGNSAWVQVFGDNSFIEYAFKFARQYAPKDCKLYYNDYNEYMDGKMNAIIEMATDLKEKGLIDGIGMQSHLDVSFPTASQYKKALGKFAATGLDIQITELDVTTSDTSEAGLEKQAQYYSDIFDAIVEYKDNISAVVLWGVTDDQSWRASRVPLLFDDQFKAKPAFYSIIDDIPDAPEVTTTETSETTTEESSETTSESEVTEETTASETEETTVSETEESTDNTTALPIETVESTSGSGTAALLGDVTCDGDIDVRDVTLLNQYIVKMADLSEDALANADVIADGTVDLKDLGQLKKYLIKVIDKF